MDKRKRILSAAAAVLVATAHSLCGQAPVSPGSPEQLATASVPFRTALHQDPTLDAPLTQLLKLYSDSRQIEQLLGIYQSHLSQYPSDVNATIVYLRLLYESGSPEALLSARQAAQSFPDLPYVQFLLFQNLKRNSQSGAVDALEKAISKETDPARRQAWTDLYTPIAIEAGRQERAIELLKARAEAEPDAAKRLEVARVFLKYHLFTPALEVLQTAAKLNAGAETSVEISLGIASAYVGLSDAKSAGEELDRLLARLTPDYWRRPEIFRRRIALVTVSEDRAALLETAKSRLTGNPKDESAILDLSLLQDSFEFRREALETLITGSKVLPESQAIEKSALDLLDRLRDEQAREKYLAEKIAQHPERADLRSLQIQSLYLLGRREEAAIAAKSLANQLKAPEKLKYQIELARFLRRSSMPAAAAPIFQEAIEANPERLDLRRELAETLIAAGKREDARNLFSGPIPDSVETENLIDLIQFMVQQKLYSPAKTALAKVLEKSPTDFDLNLLMLQIDGKLGDKATGDKRVEAIHALADSSARYRKWLDASADFYGTFDETDAFLAAEKARLEKTNYDGQPERKIAIIQTASEKGDKDNALQLMRELAEDESLKAEARVDARRELIKMLENRLDAGAELAQQLQILMEEDPSRSEEYKARLALIYSKGDRSGYGIQMIQDIDVNKINDPGVLTALRGLFQNGYGGDKLKSILERQVELSPADRGAWEQWIGAMVLSEEEDKLRTSIRKILTGIDQMPISDGTRKTLQSHLTASYWRSIVSNIRQDNPAALSDALALSAEVENVAQNDQDALWIAWTRALILNLLHRESERNSAIDELLRIATTNPDAKKEDGNPETFISFPDGMCVSIEQARKSLTKNATALSLPSRQAPEGALELKWVFETDEQQQIAQILNGGDKTVVIDGWGKLYCLEAATGKLQWTQKGGAPISSGRNSGYPMLAATATVINDGDSLFIPDRKSLTCRSVANGAVLWKSEGLGSGSLSHLILQQNGDRILSFDPESMLLCSLDKISGKLIWEKSYDVPPINSRFGFGNYNSGIVLSEGNLLLYGRNTLVVDPQNGQVVWKIDTEKSRKLPIQILERDEMPITINPRASRLPMASARAPIGSARMAVLPPSSASFSITSSRTARPQIYTVSSGAVLSPQGSFPVNRFAGYPPGQSYVLSTPLGAWQSMDNGTPMRNAMLNGATIAFSSAQTPIAIDLNLPFLAKSCPTSGQVIKILRDRLVLMQMNQLFLWNMNNGSVQNIQIDASVAAQNPDVAVPGYQNDFIGIVWDGPLLHLSSSTGMRTINISTLETINSQPWPETVAEPEVVEAVEPGQAQALFAAQSAMRMNQYNGYASPTSRSCEGVIQNGMLITTSEASKVVAFGPKKQSNPVP